MQFLHDIMFVCLRPTENTSTKKQSIDLIFKANRIRRVRIEGFKKIIEMSRTGDRAIDQKSSIMRGNENTKVNGNSELSHIR